MIEINQFVVTELGRVGLVSSRGPRKAVIQFGADGPFEHHLVSTLRPATRQQVERAGLDGVPGKALS